MRGENERPAAGGAASRPGIVPDQHCDDIQSDEAAQPRWFETAIAAIVDSVNEPIPIIVAVLLRLAARELAKVNPLPQRCRNAALLFFRMACAEAQDVAPPITLEMIKAYRAEIERVAARRRRAA